MYKKNHESNKIYLLNPWFLRGNFEKLLCD